MDAPPNHMSFNKIYEFMRVMMEVDIYFYFDFKNMTSFTTVLDILYKGKAVLIMSFFIIMQKLKLIHSILYLRKKKTFHNVITLIKSIVNKDKTTTTAIYFYKNIHIIYVKITIISKFFI